ncbi:MAG: class I SAM-dependent methyltransferase [Pseudobdellovibrio sp.]|nr:class I SAM-dependent methyltransferase [Pseudobdellovibrio sp.]
MSSPDLKVKSTITNEQVARYVVEKITVESDIEAQLRKDTTRLSQGGMISSSDVGSFLGVLAQTANAKKAIEVGTFTGYTALKIAQALPADGKIICCDISTEWTDMGKKYWQAAGVDKKIDLRIAPAMETLNSLNSQAGTFDFAFIDADKLNYHNYFEACLKLLRPGGVIVLDNMLWSGDVADNSVQDETTVALRNLNLKISQDTRVDSCLLTVGDGLMFVRKK